jgi:cytochrome P450
MVQVQNGGEWRRSRKLLTPTFHFKFLRHYMAETMDITQAMSETFTKQLSAPGANHTYGGAFV